MPLPPQPNLGRWLAKSSRGRFVTGAGASAGAALSGRAALTTSAKHPHGPSPPTTSRGGVHARQPLSAGTTRQQEHWLSDWWPQRSLRPLPVHSNATAVEPAPTAEGDALQQEKHASQLFGDQLLPDEPQTPSQSEAGFLDAGSSSSSSSSSSDLEEAVAAPAADSSAAAAASPAAAPGRSSDTSASSPAASSRSSTASGPPSSLASLSENAILTLLVPRAICGFIIGPQGATIRAMQQPDCRVWLSDKSCNLGGDQKLRFLNINGSPEALERAVQMLYQHIMSEEAPPNKAFFRTKADNMYKAKILIQKWLVGNILGKGGANIAKIRSESGAKMHVINVQEQLDRRGNRQRQPATKLDGDEAILEIAAPSVQQIAVAVRHSAALICGDPRYKPLARQPKESQLFRHGRGPSTAGSNGGAVANEQ